MCITAAVGFLVSAHNICCKYESRTVSLLSRLTSAVNVFLFRWLVGVGTCTNRCVGNAVHILATLGPHELYAFYFGQLN